MPLRKTKQTKPQTNKDALKPIFKSNVNLMLERDISCQWAFWMALEHYIAVLQGVVKKLCQKRSQLVDRMNICRINIFNLELFYKILNEMLVS